MSDLVDLWRSKTDDEVVDAMKDIGGYAEFAERGLTYRKTYREEKKELNDKKVRETLDSAKRYLFPTEMVAVVRLIGVMCVASVALSYESVIDPVRWTFEFGDVVSVALAVYGVATALWALSAACASFRPGARGWTVLLSYVSVSGVADTILNRIIAVGVWTAAWMYLYRPTVQQYMQVSEDRRLRTTKLIKRLMIAVLALPFVWSMVLWLL